MSRESPTATATTGCATAQRLPLALKTMYALSAINLTSLEPFATFLRKSLPQGTQRCELQARWKGQRRAAATGGCVRAVMQLGYIILRRRCCQIAIDGPHCSNSDLPETLLPDRNRRGVPDRSLFQLGSAGKPKSDTQIWGGGGGPEDNTANVPTSAERIM